MSGVECRKCISEIRTGLSQALEAAQMVDIGDAPEALQVVKSALLSFAPAALLHLDAAESVVTLPSQQMRLFDDSVPVFDSPIMGG